MADADLLLTEASADLLFQNPEALRGFEALLHDAPDAGAAAGVCHRVAVRGPVA